MNKQELRTNKQELISKYELLKNSYNFKVIATDAIISDLKRLDEPETGRADEAPRYVKNILARLRELPLHDREVWLKAIMGEFEKDFSHAKWREGYEQGKFEGEWTGKQLEVADNIRRELNKVKVPQFVADWIERSKQEKRNLRNALNNGGEKMRLWFLNQENYDLFARAWLDGYEVEKEKRYTVKITKTDQYLHSRDNDFFFVTYVRPDDNPHNCHTRKELEEAGFGWVFDCEGIEIEEVEDE